MSEWQKVNQWYFKSVNDLIGKLQARVAELERDRDYHKRWLDKERTEHIETKQIIQQQQQTIERLEAALKEISMYGLSEPNTQAKIAMNALTHKPGGEK